MLTTWDWGQDDNDPTQDGNSVTYRQLNPGTPNSPLSVSVTGNDITVNLATDGTGASSSTTDQVIAAINADPAASALVWADRYRGNTNTATAIPQPTAAPVHLSDFLWAPQAVIDASQRGSRLPTAPHSVPAIRPADLQGVRRFQDRFLRVRAGART